MCTNTKIIFQSIAIWVTLSLKTPFCEINIAIRLYKYPWGTEKL